MEDIEDMGNMEDDFTSTNYVTENDSYLSSYRKKFYDKFSRNHLKNFVENLFFNPKLEGQENGEPNFSDKQ